MGTYKQNPVFSYPSTISRNFLDPFKLLPHFHNFFLFYSRGERWKLFDRKASFHTQFSGILNTLAYISAFQFCAQFNYVNALIVTYLWVKPMTMKRKCRHPPRVKCLTSTSRGPPYLPSCNRIITDHLLNISKVHTTF